MLRRLTGDLWFWRGQDTPAGVSSHSAQATATHRHFSSCPHGEVPVLSSLRASSPCAALALLYHSAVQAGSALTWRHYAKGHRLCWGSAAAGTSPLNCCFADVPDDRRARDVRLQDQALGFDGVSVVDEPSIWTVKGPWTTPRPLELWHTKVHVISRLPIEATGSLWKRKMRQPPSIPIPLFRLLLLCPPSLWIRQEPTRCCRRS